MHRVFALVVAVLLGAWTALAAVLLLRDDVLGQRFGPITLRWSSRPIVWLAELALVALILVAGLLISGRVLRASGSRTRALAWAGGGLLAIGVLCALAGLVGLAVESPGIDPLARDEALYIIGGAAQMLIGLALALPGLASGAGAPED